MRGLKWITVVPQGVVRHVRIQEPTQDFLPLVIGISVAGVGMLICFGIWYTQYRKSLYKCIRLINDKTDNQSLKDLLKQYGSLAPKRYNYREIKKMTHGFKDKLGEGGYGGVYKGELSDGRAVAVKILKASKVGIAEGLEYLDRGYNTTILHFDIKPHNILLDEEFCPKILDFGLAKLCTWKENIVSMLGARGAIRYVPESRFIIMYYRCNDEVLSHIQLPSNINFSVRRTTSTDVFFADEIVGNYVRGCSFSIVVPLVSTAYQQLWDTTLRLQEAVNEGFEVDYSGASGDDDLKLHRIIDNEEEKTARKMIFLARLEDNDLMLHGIIDKDEEKAAMKMILVGRNSLTTQEMTLNASLISPSSSSLCSPEASANS
ncbi:hypothetical protein RND71_021636 [Anisodus tanguticus]|uniref:Protein kinase domain-containing protein n=1 Tax=Anisodus tanguticus TaxID=243964 RepID=A0AAE1V8F2_9SOLA|nr:hypothetical protein RND71_021636 [Anisodus tanguticus]